MLNPSLLNQRIARALRGPALFAFSLLVVEFMDELVFGVQSAALPLIRDDLRLSYTQVGLLITLPMLAAYVLDPLIGLMGDLWKRKTLVVGGALVTAAAMGLIAAGHSFAALVLALALVAPASTAYVSLSQATLMDLNPGRTEHAMARWTVFGSVGQFAGPLLVATALGVGLGWRNVYAGLAVLLAGVALALARLRFNGQPEPDSEGGFLAGLRDIPAAVRGSGILRWLVLLELADLLLDVFYNFLALYFTDVVGATPIVAGAAVAVLTVGGVLGDLLLIPLLERVDGVRLVRTTAALALVLYAAFLALPGLWPKLAVLAVLGPMRSGWYQVLQGRAYASLPGRSGTVVALGALGGVAMASFPAILGALAERFGLAAAMTALALGPVSLLIGLPRSNRPHPPIPSPVERKE